MKSIKNHLSLILALVSILFAIQTFFITDRALAAYEENLKDHYSVVVVSEKKLDPKTLQKRLPYVENVVEIELQNAIRKIDKNISEKNMRLLVTTLPHFYKVTLKKYPTSQEIVQLKKSLYAIEGVKKVEDFKESHDLTYKLLLLFKSVVAVFSLVVFVITLLLISKELRIWQYKHKERMNIMGLFGAPKWLSSAVLFRLAIVDAIISSILVMVLFSFIAHSRWLLSKLESIGIEIVVFDIVKDFPLLFFAALLLSVVLASTIVFTHKEEV